MHACPRCWEVIDDSMPMTYAEGTLLQEAAGSYGQPAREQTVVVAAPVPLPQVVPPPPVSYDYDVVYRPASVTRPSGIRFGRLLAIGLAAGLIVALGLLLLEFFGPRLRGTLPDQVHLERQAFSNFAISVPEGWDVRQDEIGSRPAVSVLEPAGADDVAGLSEFHIVLEKESFAVARKLADLRAPPSARNYEEINIVDGIRIDGLKTFRHMYTDDDEYVEQWWIERGDGTYRIEFKSPVARREESALLNVRIARSFDVL